jgi:hypothetical protein
MTNPGENDGKSSIDDIKSALLSLTDVKTYLDGLDDILYFSTQLNKSFLEGRTRIEQMQYALSDVTPSVVRLGGDMQKTLTTMSEIADASRRNVIATEETVTELFAASQLLDTSARQLSNAFLDVGISINNVGENLESSIGYVQSIGMNARQVVGAVVDEMGKLNRYQFEGGVLGLTKMAAQASMLRVDMGETFKLAEKVLTPEGAIEVAAAFQRLGVAAGSLVNPFELMNMSINDPSGLQTSLAQVAQSFVSFSEKAGRFTISREGVLRLREMEEQAGLSSGTLSKMGLAAAEMGERMKQVSMAGLKFENEEDKQFLANITTLGEDGIFKITLEDNTKVDLNKINQEQFDRLIEREKDRPKTLEEMQRAQMTTTELILADVKAIRDKIVGGVVTMGPLPKSMEEVRSISTSATKAVERSFTTQEVRGVLTGVYKDLEELFKGGGNLSEKIKKWEQTTEDKLGKIDDTILRKIDKITENFKSGLRKSSDNEMQIAELLSDFQTDILKPLQPNSADQYMGQSFLEGQQPLSSQMSQMKTPPGSTTSTSTQLSGNLTMTINHTFPPEFSKLSDSEKLKLFDEYLEKQMGNLTFESYLKKVFDKAQSQTFPIKR